MPVECSVKATPTLCTGREMREAIAMRRRDREVVDVAEKEAILGRVTCGHLAMLHDGKPYGVTLNFGWERDSAGSYVLWFHCAGEGRKIDALTANRNVWFFAEREGEFHEKVNAAGQTYMTMTYESVAGEGTVEFVSGMDEKRHGLGVICARFTETPVSVIPDSVVAATCVFKVVVPRMTAKRH